MSRAVQDPITEEIKDVAAELPPQDAPLALPPAKGDQFTDVEQYDPAVKARAFDLMLHSSLGMDEIAIDVGVKTAVIARWAQTGKWLEHKKAIEDEMFALAERHYREFLIKNRMPTLLRHLEASKKLEEAIIKRIGQLSEDDRVKTIEFKQIAEALSASAGVSSRASGVSEVQAGARQEQMGKRPLVMIGIKGVAPEVSIQQTEG